MEQKKRESLQRPFTSPMNQNFSAGLLLLLRSHDAEIYTSLPGSNILNEERKTMSDPAHRTVESRNTAVIHEADVPFYQIVKPKLNYGYWDQQERSSNEESSG